MVQVSGMCGFCVIHLIPPPSIIAAWSRRIEYYFIKKKNIIVLTVCNPGNEHRGRYNALTTQMRSLYCKSKEIKGQETLCCDIKTTYYNEFNILIVHMIHFNILLCILGVKTDTILQFHC